MTVYDVAVQLVKGVFLLFSGLLRDSISFSILFAMVFVVPLVTCLVLGLVNRYARN